MNDKLIIKVCDRTNGHQFIERIMGVSQLSFSAIRNFGREYEHILECDDCINRVGKAVEDYNLGITGFSVRKFNKILFYLEYANGYHG